MRFRRLLLLLTPLMLSGCVFWTPRSLTPSSSAVVLTHVPAETWDITSCGAGALSAVLRHHGDPTTMAEWDRALPKIRGGVLSVDLLIAARERGFDARLVSGDSALVEEEVRAGRPVIVMLQVIQAPGRGYDFFHYIVIDGFDPQRRLFRALFGDGRGRWIAPDRIEQAWRATKHALITIRPRDPLAEGLRAAVRLEEEGKTEAAIDAYRAILKTNPAAAVVWTNLANAETRSGRRDAAERSLRRALEIDPESADAMNNLAWLLYEERRLREAEPLARRAAGMTAPDRWTRLDTLGRILAANGSCHDALAVFREALAAVPDSRSSERREIETAARACGG
jgi:hypothetical protein